MAVVTVDFSALTPEQLDNYVREHYPTYAWMLAIPDVGDILRNAFQHPDDPNVSGPEAVQSKIQSTNWWRTTSVSQRAYQQKYIQDPATLQREQADRYNTVHNWATSAGINITEFDLHQLADDSLAYAWDDATTRSSMLERVSLRDQATGVETKAPSGSIASTSAQIKALAAQYLMPFSDASANDWAKKIWAGTATMDTLTGTFSQQALDAWGGRNPAIADAINRGVSPLDFLQPQVNALASTLQMSPQQINLMDPKWNKILNYTDSKGDLRMMTVPEVEQFARNQHEYRYTDQANKDADSKINTLLRGLGAVKM